MYWIKDTISEKELEQNLLPIQETDEEINQDKLNENKNSAKTYLFCSKSFIFIYNFIYNFILP